MVIQEYITEEEHPGQDSESSVSGLWTLNPVPSNLRPQFLMPLLVLLVAVCISAQAAEPAVWSFRKPVRPSVPDKSALKHGDRVLNPIDAFIFARLEQAELSAAPLADRYTLVRRAYLDLIGLPPTPEEVEKFVSDESPQAWPNLINELLKSDHYGERWGRHWLDVARYADSGGFEGDMSHPYAWRYRDYVVRSFNRDTPYDTFVQQQIAGDEIWPDNLELDPKRVYDLSSEQLRHLDARLGTGLYGIGPRVQESALDARRLHYETLTDWVDTTGSMFLGLTIGCARCHEHKFDPITQEDYYAMQAIFTSSIETNIPVMSAMEVATWFQSFPRAVALHEARIAYMVFQKRTGKRELTEEGRSEEQRLRDAIVQKVMELPERGNSRPHTDFDPLTQMPVARVLGHERPELIKPVHFLERGELSRPKQRVDPALPAALAKATGRSKDVAGPFGNRKELALWLTQPDHPLTARVMVNRIWQWHFGQAIVSTPNDFGHNGEPPSHAELLDWLAIQFVARGWSIKSLHRLIMTSSTYQMTSRFGTDAQPWAVRSGRQNRRSEPHIPGEFQHKHSLGAHQRVDPDNRLLWRMNRRRLEAEALWDSVHHTAGTINLKIGGRPVVPPLAKDEIVAMRDPWKWPVSGDPAEHTRRGLYILVLRNFRFPMFDVFDAPVNSMSCPKRDVTTVALQALWGLNSPSVYRQAGHLAGRVVREAGPEPNNQVERLWMIALSRPVRVDEKQQAVQLLERLEKAARTGDLATLEKPPKGLASLSPAKAAALQKLCLAVYNLNEFAFVD